MVLTYPLALHLGSQGYKANQVGDAQYSIWNVAWVAHALLTDPGHVLDANIFFPYRSTLIYSEANLLTGVLAVPVYALTNNPFAAHNFVVLLSFVLSATGAYYLVRYLVGDRRAAIISAVCFAFCPFVFGHLLHIQILMTAGIPFSLLAFHRLADQPSAGRGAALGLAMGLQGLACAYYAVFVALLIGYVVLFTATTTGLWRNRSFWTAVSVAAGVSLAIVMPLFWMYLQLQRDTGFGRELQESGHFSATWSSYLTSSSFTSSWIYPWLLERLKWRSTTDQLFPGFVTVLFGIAGGAIGWRAGGRARHVAALYSSITALAFWESFGPSGGLYGASYYLPGFAFLRAPSRFGIIVVMGLSVLTGLTVSTLLRLAALPAVTAAALLVAVVANQATPVPLTPIEPIHPAYRLLAHEPDGGLLEMPPRSHKFAFTRTQYMINSMVHWKPLINAYSDVIPDTLFNDLDVLAEFPSDKAFAVLQRDGVRYVTFNLRAYDKEPRLRRTLDANLRRFSPYLRSLYADERLLMFAIIGYPQVE